MTTSDVARLLGVTGTTVKRWVAQERLQCVTTPGGHRRFERGEIERFRKALGGRSDDLEFRFLQHLLEGRDIFELQSVLIEMRARLGTWWRVADILGAALTELGQEWQRGLCSIFQEHQASRRFQQALWGCVAGLPSPSPEARCLLAAVEGDEHTLGLSLAEICLREAGWKTLWLGSPTPTPVLIEAIQKSPPRMVAVSASAFSRDAALLDRHCRSIARACRQCGAMLVLGGEGAWPQTPAHGHRVRTFAEFALLLAGSQQKPSVD